MTADGSRFLIAHRIGTGGSTASTLTGVTNWLVGLEQYGDGR